MHAIWMVEYVQWSNRKTKHKEKNKTLGVALYPEKKQRLLSQFLPNSQSYLHIQETNKFNIFGYF